MSETDDTDELLIIPPDFFLDSCPSLGPYYGVVDSLITQVGQLEHRINFIESASDLSLASNSPEMHSPAKSTPQKPRSKFTMASSLPGSPLDRHKARARAASPMLGEIDAFLSNVKMIKRANAARNLEGDFAEAPKGRDLDEMLREMDLEKKETWQRGDDAATADTSSDSTQATAFDRYRDLGLVSLAKLWNGDVADSPSKFQQQLQEERLRRQHCEQAIQELQHRVLELQERVAVAIQVDEAKDKAILKFHQTWEKTGAKLGDVEKEKQKLLQEIDALKKQANDGANEANQKIAYYEKEASKALDLAQCNQEKAANLEKRCFDLENDLKTAEINSEEFQKKYLAEIEKNRQYPEILAQKDLELNDIKAVLAEARKEVAQSKKAVEICQTEIYAMKEENEALLIKLNSEKENLKKNLEQKNKFLEEINAHKSISKGLQDELTKTREQLENNKIELKNFYQGQVELVVQNKLKEFQKQLDEAEKALKEELSKKELQIAKTAASHIQQISEKHSLEIKLLEEKHQEECRLYQLQTSQLRHELDESNLKLKKQNEKHVHIEKQLHRFMESLRQDHVTTLDEMNSFRSRSYTNLEEILAFNMAEEERNRKGAEFHGDPAYRMQDTPLTSRNEKGGRKRESSLQETIQMLLDRKQGEKGYEEQQQATREGGFYQRIGKDMKGKPPWK